MSYQFYRERPEYEFSDVSDERQSRPYEGNPELEYEFSEPYPGQSEDPFQYLSYDEMNEICEVLDTVSLARLARTSKIARNTCAYTISNRLKLRKRLLEEKKEELYQYFKTTMSTIQEGNLFSYKFENKNSDGIIYLYSNALSVMQEIKSGGKQQLLLKSMRFLNFSKVGTKIYNVFIDYSDVSLREMVENIVKYNFKVEGSTFI